MVTQKFPLTSAIQISLNMISSLLVSVLNEKIMILFTIRRIRILK